MAEGQAQMITWSQVPARRRRAITIEAAARYGYRCHLCGELIDPYDTTSERRLSPDHVIPVAKGGAHSVDNIRPAHLDCNKRRGARRITRRANRIDQLGYFLEP